MVKIPKKIILAIFLFFISTNIVKAEIEIISGGLSQGSNSDCSKTSGYVACYSPKFQFRVTLVNENGEKIQGTNSVDFTYHDGDKLEVFTSASLRGKQIGLINSNYQYKYGYNNSDNFKYVEMRLIEGSMAPYRTGNNINGKDDHSRYEAFFNEFINNVVPYNDSEQNRYRRKEYIRYNNVDYDFLSIFAYLSGYTTTEIDNRSEKNLKIETTSKAKEIEANNYYLLIEPTFVIYYNTIPDSTNYIYKYGTGRELVEWLRNEIKNNKEKYLEGYLAGLSLNFVYQASCNLYTPQNNKANFKIIGNTNCSYTDMEGLGKKIDSDTYPERKDRPGIMDSVLKKDTGYGAFTLKLENICEGVCGPSEKTIKYNIDLCKTDKSKISFSNYSTIDNGIINNEIFLMSGTHNENSAVYCYDNIIYDFSGIINEVNKKKFNKLDKFTIPNSTLTINRSCLFRGGVGNENGANFNKYKEIPLKLKIFNEEVVLINKSSKNYVITNTTRTNSIYGQTGGWTNYTLTLEFGPEEGNETIQLSPSIDYDGEAYIDFSNYTNENLFGSDIYVDKSNNIITNAFKAPITINDLQIETTISSNDERKCKFNYTIDDKSLPFNGEGLQFRVISLSNPFPARDGTSRLPGTNWLDAKNYVYDYIDNNRAIQYKIGKIEENTKVFKENGKADPNAMYTNTEPMYIIDLDASTMKKIREYNKDHTYTDIKLTCDSNNRQCTSNFLRNELEGVNIPIKLTGVCSNKDDYNKVLVNYNGITEERLRKVIYGGGFYQKRYDINKNLRNDTDDLEIFFNKNKNTFFYTCADKTFLSGG